VTVFR